MDPPQRLTDRGIHQETHGFHEFLLNTVYGLIARVHQFGFQAVLVAFGLSSGRMTDVWSWPWLTEPRERGGCKDGRLEPPRPVGMTTYRHRGFESRVCKAPEPLVAGIPFSPTTRGHHPPPDQFLHRVLVHQLLTSNTESHSDVGSQGSEPE